MEFLRKQPDQRCLAGMFISSVGFSLTLYFFAGSAQPQHPCVPGMAFNWRGESPLIQVFAEPKVSEKARALPRGRVWRKPNAKSRGDEQELNMRCEVFGASGQSRPREAFGSVTAKPSICKRDTFYKLGVYARKVKCLTPGGL